MELAGCICTPVVRLVHEAMHRRTYVACSLVADTSAGFLSTEWYLARYHREKDWDSIDAYLHIDHRDVCLVCCLYTPCR